MKKSIIIIVIIIFSSVLFFFIYLKNDNNVVDLKSPKVASMENDKLNDNDRQDAIKQEILQKKVISDAENYTKAVEDGKFSRCDEIMSTTTKNACFQNVAIKSMNPDICNKILDETVKNDCLFLTYQKVTIDRKDVNYCKKIQNNILVERCKRSFIGALKSSFCDNEGCVGAVYDDNDQDGLNDDLELEVYKTSISDKDTDGDGYTDSDEVKNGFDPLK